jgi:hypothetical protein
VESQKSLQRFIDGTLRGPQNPVGLALSIGSYGEHSPNSLKKIAMKFDL